MAWSCESIRMLICFRSSLRELVVFVMTVWKLRYRLRFGVRKVCQGLCGCLMQCVCLGRGIALGSFARL